MLVFFKKAIRSNCGNTLEPLLPSQLLKSAGGQVNNLGYGKNVRERYNELSAAYPLQVQQYKKACWWEWFRDLMSVDSVHNKFTLI
jgi:hypothetical protein